MGNKVYILLAFILLFTGCSASKKLTPIRYDGIYKQYNKNNVTYRKFEKDKKIYNTVVLPNEDDQRAIEELNKKLKTNKNPDKFVNRLNKIKTYGQNSHGSWHGDFKKNKLGELKDNFFIKVENNKIKEVLDLRIIDEYKIFNRMGKEIINGTFEAIQPIYNGYMIIKKNDKYGIYNINSKKIIMDLKYQWIESNNKKEIRAFKIDNKYGFVDKDFNIIIKAKYEDIHHNKESFLIPRYFMDNIQAVKENGKWIFINPKDEKVFNINISRVGNYNSKKFVPIFNKEKNYYEVYNLETNKKTKYITYDNLIYGGKYNVLKIEKGKNILVKNNGELALTSTYDDIIPYKFENQVFFRNEVFFLVEEKNKRGLFNENQELIIPLQYKDISFLETPSNKRYIKAKLNPNNIKIFDTKGKKIFEKSYAHIEIFNDKKEYFLTKFIDPFQKVYRILKKGSDEPLFEASYIHGGYKPGDYLFFRKNGLYGIIDRNLNIISKAKYKDIFDIKNNYFYTYDAADRKSKIYKIENGKIHLIGKLDGIVFIEDYYIIARSGIYNYNLKRLNKKNVLSSKVPKDNTSPILYQTVGNFWKILNDEKISNINGDFEIVKWNNEFLIGKLLYKKK